MPLSFFLVAVAALSTQPAPNAAPAPIAVVELFTSEGCSSCPPADRLLNDLAARAARDHVPLFPIAFHVDYWDNLGWKDPFASPDFTRRQHEYADAFPSAGLYTPQMIVNGRDQFVGSDDGRATAAIDRALAIPPSITIEASSGAVANGRVHFSAHLAPATSPSERPAHADWHDLDLVVVLVQSGLETAVKRGENAGRTLHHDNVARAVVTRSLDAAKPDIQCDLDLPIGADPARCSIIAFVQNRRTREITGAGSSPVSPAPVATQGK